MITQRIFTILFLSCLNFIGHTQNSNYKKEAETGHKVAEIQGLQTVSKALNFLVMGDWGRHGEENQKAVAAQMTSASVGIDATFIIATGDNFYPKGVISVNDPSWRSSFEEVYYQHPLFIDWYVVLGNHDYKTNPDAEVAYSSVSARWHMPARYFSIQKTLPDGGKAEFFYIDSSPFQKDYYDDEEYGPKVRTADTTAQKKWLENGLKNSKATWKFVVGHHPLYSAGKRKGKTNDMLYSFAPLFEKFKVDAYFCGHEHQLEFDQPEGYHFVEFISGAGAEATAVTSAPYAKFVAQDFGFLTASLTAKELLVQFINKESKILYTTKIVK